MIRLLLVEDDALIGEMIRINLQQQGYHVTWLRDGDAAAKAVLDPGYALILLDVMLPGRLGFDVAREARTQGITTPILMLTARSDTSSKVTGLDSGADDYLTKPFDMPELMARLRALLRRSGTEAEGAPRVLLLGSCRVDLQSRDADTVHGADSLSPSEIQVLELLSRRRGHVLTLSEMVDELAQTPGPELQDFLSTQDGVRDTINRLREHFEPDVARPRYFVHVRSGGYRFES